LAQVRSILSQVTLLEKAHRFPLLQRCLFRLILTMFLRLSLVTLAVCCGLADAARKRVRPMKVNTANADTASRMQCSVDEVTDSYDIQGVFGGHFNSCRKRPEWIPGLKVLPQSKVFQGLQATPSGTEEAMAACFALRGCDYNNFVVNTADRLGKFDLMRKGLSRVFFGEDGAKGTTTKLVDEISTLVKDKMASALSLSDDDSNALFSLFFKFKAGDNPFCHGPSRDNAPKIAATIASMLTSEEAAEGEAPAKSSKLTEQHAAQAHSLMESLVLGLLFADCPRDTNVATTEQSEELEKTISKMRVRAGGETPARSPLVDRTFDLLASPGRQQPQMSMTETDALQKTFDLYNSFLDLAGEDAVLADVKVPAEAEDMLQMLEAAPGTAFFPELEGQGAEESDAGECTCRSLEDVAAARFLRKLQRSGLHLGEITHKDDGLQSTIVPMNKKTDISSMMRDDTLRENVHMVEQVEIANQDPVLGLVELLKRGVATQQFQGIVEDLGHLPRSKIILKALFGAKKGDEEEGGGGGSSAAVKQIMVLMPVIQNVVSAAKTKLDSESTDPEVFALKMQWILALNIAWASFHQFETFSDDYDKLKDKFADEARYGDVRFHKQITSMGFLTTAMSVLQEMTFSTQKSLLRFSNNMDGPDNYNDFDVAIYTLWNYGFVKFYNIGATEADKKDGGEGIGMIGFVFNMMVNALAGPIVQSLENHGDATYWVNYRRDGLMQCIINNRNNFDKLR